MVSIIYVYPQLKCLYVFPLLSHPWAALLSINPSKIPFLCGPGGAGARCPEDRSSAGSQNHLSMPLPLFCNPPGTALTSAPGVCERDCVCVCLCVGVQEKQMFKWLIMQKRVSCVCMSVFQPARKHTILSVAVNSWPYQHDGCTTTSSVLQFPHVKLLTWLNVSSCYPDSAAKSPRLILF